MRQKTKEANEEKEGDENRMRGDDELGEEEEKGNNKALLSGGCLKNPRS